jgi:Rrf2 family nitric oxide-sensitive transcriptional repressor
VRLTQHTDYAIRVLMFATSLWGSERLASIREIAEAFGVSENHLMKVVHRLGQAGLLHTQRGRHGGLRLAQDPASTRLGDVVRAIEEDMALVECFTGQSTCPMSGACALAGALDGARTAFLDELNRYTLADLVPRARARQIVALSGRLAAAQTRQQARRAARPGAVT